MRPAFPASDYYGGSAPARWHQPTPSLPYPKHGVEGPPAGSHVHCRSIDGIDDQLLPCGPAVTTSAVTRHETPTRRYRRRQGPGPPENFGVPTHRIISPDPPD